MTAFFRPGFRKSFHGFSHNIHHGLFPCLQPVFCCRGRLRFQRKFYAPVFQHVIDAMKKWKNSADPQIRHCLIYNFLHFNRRYAQIQRTRQNFFKLVESLAPKKSSQNRRPRQRDAAQASQEKRSSRSWKKWLPVKTTAMER